MPPVFGVLFDGLAYGMLLFLLSVGLSVTLGMMNFVNLAHCSFAMLGGYVTVTLMNALGWPFLATLPVAFVAAAAAYIYGTDQQLLQMPAYLRGSFVFAGLNFAAYRLFLIAVAVLITIALIAGIEATRFGAQVR